MSDFHYTMQWLVDQIQALEHGDLECAGIYANKPGYHNKRGNLPQSDYSVQTAPDKRGPADLAAAFDMTSHSAQGGNYGIINKYSKRLLEAGRSHDPRMAGWREFFGQTDTDGSVEGWDFYYKEDSTSADTSHNWHIHCSELREFTESIVNKHCMLSVWKGESLAEYLQGGGQLLGTQKPPAATLHRAWPKYMPSNHYFGLITGPTESHGGYYTNEKSDVQAIQQRLIALGYVPGVTNPASGWADGKFEQATKDAVTRWQKAKYASTTSRFGEVWSDDWTHLFTY